MSNKVNWNYLKTLKRQDAINYCISHNISVNYASSDYKPNSIDHNKSTIKECDLNCLGCQYINTCPNSQY